MGDRKKSPRPGLEIHAHGFGAELAFCRMFNKYPDLTCYARAGGCDLTLDDGTTVDVKHNPREDGDLLIAWWKKEEGRRCDIYVLMTGDFPTYTYRGWALASEVFETEGRLVDLGHGPTFLLEQKDLRQGIPGEGNDQEEEKT